MQDESLRATWTHVSDGIQQPDGNAEMMFVFEISAIATINKKSKNITLHSELVVDQIVALINTTGAMIGLWTNRSELDSQYHALYRHLIQRGIPAKKLVHVASNAHLITDFHRAEDGKDEKIGTTKRGNGPAYRDKYARKGVRAMHDPRLQPYIISM